MMFITGLSGLMIMTQIAKKLLPKALNQSPRNKLLKVKSIILRILKNFSK